MKIGGSKPTPERCTMPKLFGLILLPLIMAGCTKPPVDPIAAEMAETAAQIDAMKRHPSLLERAKTTPGEQRAVQK